MIPNSLRQRLCAVLIAAGTLAIGLAPSAQAADTSARTAATMTTPACKEALQSAWFERQRQITEGYTDTRVLQTPRECRSLLGSDDSAESKRDQLAARSETDRRGESPRPQP